MAAVDGREIAAIFVGGAAGAAARATLATELPSNPTSWPWVTFSANIVGTILLGYFATRLQERLPLSSYRRPLLGTGFCGGLTTFSTMQLEIVRMIESRAYGLAAVYTAASVVAGLLAVHVATASVRRIRVRL